MNLDSKLAQSIACIGGKYPEIKKIVLFGSRARGDNSAHSDIDLAVYLKDNTLFTINHGFYNDIDQIETLLKIDVTVMSQGLEEKFIENVKAEGVAIYMGKFEHKYENFKKAIDKLAIVAEQYTPDNDIVRDSLIQRFEFCYELAWKTLKEYLQYNGLTTESMPRPVFKVAYEHQIIEDEQVWLAMIKDRNVAAHEYNEEAIQVVAEHVKNQYFPKLKNLAAKLEVH